MTPRKRQSISKDRAYGLMFLLAVVAYGIFLGVMGRV